MNSTKGITAYQIINEYPVERLIGIFYQYGELSEARQLANQIDRHREKKIETTTELVEIVTPPLPRGKENKLSSPNLPSPPHRSE
ncbi:MAG: 16S rRNA (cytosine(1402)-N(4))-methyltransferase, partial [Bacteroidales bacterium]|nr:16S rRNA (cytosine(1402)-N(4))-methyltransferase [Bacteroidales bacterium]